MVVESSLPPSDVVGRLEEMTDQGHFRIWTSLDGAISNRRFKVKQRTLTSILFLPFVHGEVRAKDAGSLIHIEASRPWLGHVAMTVALLGFAAMFWPLTSADTVPFLILAIIWAAQWFLQKRQAASLMLALKEEFGGSPV